MNKNAALRQKGGFMGNVRAYTPDCKKQIIRYKGAPVLSVNMKYPVFEELSDNKNEKFFVNKVNRFYSQTCENYIRECSGGYSSKAASLYKKNGGIMTSLVLNFQVAYSDENYISVFVDVSAFDGKKVQIRRFSQLWSAEKNAVLPASKIFDTGFKAKRYVKELICSIAEKNSKRKDFTYFDNYTSIINSKFDFSNFYFVPSGAAFFFDGGMLSASMPDVCVFVIPFENLRDIIKLPLFLKNN